MVCAVIFSNNQFCVDGWGVRKHEVAWILADILLLFKTFRLKKGDGVFIKTGAFNRNNAVFIDFTTNALTDKLIYLW